MSFAGRIEALITIPTGGVTLSATNALGGPTTVTIPAGTYYHTSAGGVSSLITEIQTQLNASRPNGWTVSCSRTGTSADGRVTINCTQVPYSISWTNTVLRDLLGFTSNITTVSAAVIGTTHARGLWLPKSPLWLDGDPAMAPKYSDLRQAETPRGDLIGHVSNVSRRHKRLRWSHVPKDRYRESQATYDYGSWEAFLDDVQHGQGHSFFTTSNKVQIYDHNDQQVGADASVTGWYMHGLEAVEGKHAVDGFTGYYTIEIPEISTSG